MLKRRGLKFVLAVLTLLAAPIVALAVGVEQPEGEGGAATEAAPAAGA